jgi:hypothetical protein
MGKASRSKRDRTREQAKEWSPLAAAREARMLRDETLRLLPGNQLLLATAQESALEGLQAIYRGARAGGMDEDDAKTYALALTIGAVGRKPPWSRANPDLKGYAQWLAAQRVQLLQNADVLVASPAVHAAVMAAAATLEIAETATLDRASDLVVPTGLLLLPEPIILTNRNGSMSDVRAYGWDFADLHSNYPDHATAVPGVRVTSFMDRDGPLQPEAWREQTAMLRAAGYRFPRLIPDGEEGMAANGALKDLSTQELQETSEAVNEVHAALRANTPQQPAAIVGEWQAGQPVDDRQATFTRRYMFAFWRLLAQDSLVIQDSAPGTGPGGGRRAPTADDSGVRVVQLGAPRRQPGEAAPSGRAYHHRWPVRMHKVRQWYPSLGEHRIIWRGPYIKGPADAPLLMTEKVYSVS